MCGVVQNNEFGVTFPLDNIPSVKPSVISKLCDTSINPLPSILLKADSKTFQL